MSLETALHENTVAIRELIAAISKGVPVAASTVDKVVSNGKQIESIVHHEDGSATVEQGLARTGKKTEAKKPVAETASSQPGATPQSADQPADAQEAKTPESAEKVELTYDDAKKALLELSKVKGREKTVALLSRFGVVKGPDLKPEQWADFIKQANRVMRDEWDPELADTAEESIA